MADLKRWATRRHAYRKQGESPEKTNELSKWISQFLDCEQS